MEYLSVFSKPSSMLTLKIMSFHSNYVNFGCHKVMLLIHIKSHYIKNRVYFVFAKASTVQSVNNTILL